ncbi:hypothetical protein PV327_001953 [Microctonus hyperodae]|uniref:SET and MYND domain-containing protein 4 n=1 Tax=Microctonus hyperodae TaxID=165561 RepID=A0AA39FEV9_MICHY|nr:hypothetical protein PV327_001953 [Microctonus hyperodae]
MDMMINDILFHRWMICQFMCTSEYEFYNIILKNDEERIKNALKYLAINETAIDIEKNDKSTDRALSYIEEGNKKFESLYWEDLLEIYTKAAMYARNDSNELARAYGNLATRDINAGETLFVHKSYATVIGPEFAYKYCWYCCKRAWSAVPCHKCIEVIYCDETCRDKAWSEHHEIECGIISAFTREDSDLYELLALRLTVKAYKEAGGLKKLRKKIKKIDAIDDPILKLFTNNVFDPTKYESVYSLWREYSSSTRFIVVLKATMILYFLAATTNIFGAKITNFAQLLNNPEAIFIGRLILVNLGVAVMNGAKLSVDDNAGYSLDPLWCLFNHSCDPETINFTSGDIMTLLAFQRLEKGQQVTINYGRPFFYADLPSRQVLHNSFKFECKCRACNEYWGPDFSVDFPHCEVYSPTALMKKLGLSTIFGKFKKLAHMRTANDNIKVLLIPDLFRVLDFYHRVYGYPRNIFQFIVTIIILHSETIGQILAMHILGRVFAEYDEWKQGILQYTEQRSFRAYTDEQKVRIVLEYLMFTKRKLNIQYQSKSMTKAGEYIEKGEKLLQVQLCSDAVEIFTKAIMHAEIDSYELVLGYTKRSVALCQGGMYRNAQSDLERALIINRSSNELGSLFTYQMEYLTIIENEISHGNVESLPNPPQINSQMQMSWDSIFFKNNKTLGPHAVATRLIQVGEILTCRDRAWQDHHDIECSVICAISGQEQHSLDLLALRLTVKAYKEAGTLEKLQEKVNEIDQIRDRVLKCNTHGLFDPTKYASVYSLLRNTNHYYITAVRAFAILCSLAATTNILGEKIKHLKTLSKNKYATFIGGLIKRNFEICLANSTKLTLDDDIGLVLDPCWSMFLHSDNPSVTNFSSGGTSTLIAIEDIRKGDKILLRSDPGFVYNIYGKRKDRVNYSEFSKIVEGS